MLDRAIPFVRAVFVAALAGSTFASAEPDPYLRIATRTDGFAFHLTGANGAGPWLLQHSSDGRDWQDLLFLEDEADGGEEPGIEIQRGILPKPDARNGLFRAVRLAAENPFLRRFLTERAKWRLFGQDNYQYELRQNFGAISWHGVAIVSNDGVASFETINLQPPVVEVPDVPTIDGLFDRIARAIAANAATINVTWNRTYGYPTSCFIDLDLLLADEEQGWTIEAYTPVP